MKNKLNFYLGVSITLIGQILTFVLWFDGKNINGANDYSNIILLSSLVFGLILIIKSFNPKSFDIYVYLMAFPVLLYFSYPSIMGTYKTLKLKGKTQTTFAVINKIGDHIYRRKHTEKYYEFNAIINSKSINKFNEDIFHIVDWKLNVGDTIKIEYSIENTDLIRVVEKK